MALFNSKGELNASSVQEALQIIQKYASSIEDNAPSNLSLSQGISDDRRNELVEKALLSHDGKVALAQAMANPIRKNLDYMGVARRALVVDALPQGALPVYDRDIDVSACVVSSNGSGVESRVFGDRVTVPTFEIFANPTVRMSEVRRRRFNVIDRAVQKARQEIMAQEDANVFMALDKAAELENMVQDIADGGMLKRDLIEIKTQVEKWDLVVSKFFMNINEYNDILAWGSGGGQAAGSGGELDPVSMREILQTGIRAQIWGADIIVSKIVPSGTVFGVADAEFVGVMPVRADIEVYPADEPRRVQLGWVVVEEIGIGIVNSRGVAKGTKTTLAG